MSAKKNNKKQRNQKQNTRAEAVVLSGGDELSKLIKIVGIILAVLVVFYLITWIVTKNRTESHLPSGIKNPTVIQYDEIIIGDMFHQDAKEYYVLVQAEKDEYVSLYARIISDYLKKEDALTVYFIDLGNAFNKGYVADTSDIRAQNISDIRFSETTLVLVKDGKVAEAYEGMDDISAHLKKLVEKEEEEK